LGGRGRHCEIKFIRKMEKLKFLFCNYM